MTATMTAPVTPSMPLLTARQALLFVSEPGDAALRQLLTETLQRLSIQAAQQRVVVLQSEPLMGRQHRVRVTPCLLLDMGTRWVQLLGELSQHDSHSLQQALTRQ